MRNLKGEGPAPSMLMGGANRGKQEDASPSTSLNSTPVHTRTHTHAHACTHNLLAVHTHTQPAGCVRASLCECLSCACVCVHVCPPWFIPRSLAELTAVCFGRRADVAPFQSLQGEPCGGWGGSGGEGGGVEGWGGVSNRRAPSNSLHRGRKKNDKKNTSRGRWGSGRYCYQYLTLV